MGALGLCVVIALYITGYACYRWMVNERRRNNAGS